MHSERKTGRPQEMRSRVARYRKEPVGFADHQVGCRILTNPFFLPREQWIPAPASWAANIVVGKTYDAQEGDGRLLWEAIISRVPLAGLV